MNFVCKKNNRTCTSCKPGAKGHCQNLPSGSTGMAAIDLAETDTVTAVDSINGSSNSISHSSACTSTQDEHLPTFV